MSYGSEKSFNGKSQKSTNKKNHKAVLTVAALILIAAAVAWTMFYSKAMMSTEKVNPMDPPAQTTTP